MIARLDPNNDIPFGDIIYRESGQYFYRKFCYLHHVVISIDDCESVDAGDGDEEMAEFVTAGSLSVPKDCGTQLVAEKDMRVIPLAQKITLDPNPPCQVIGVVEQEQFFVRAEGAR